MDARRTVTFAALFAGRYPDLTLATALVVVALAIRLISLTTVPPNITADEADNLQFVLMVLEGKGPGLFGLDWKPAPAFSIYLMAWFTNIFGLTIAGLRLASVVLSAFTIIPIYYLAREHVSKLSAGAAALLLSTNLWFLHFSRSGWENVHIAFYGAMSAWMLTLALKRQRSLFYAAAGLFAALGLYGYFAGRFIIASILLSLPFALWQHRGQARQVLIGYALLIAVCLAVFAPQMPTIVQNWEPFNRRLETVSIFNAPLPYLGRDTLAGVLLHQIGTTLRAFVLMDGTAIVETRYFPGNRPLFDLFTASFYLAGLALGLAQWRKAALWWCMLVIPIAGTQVFSTNTPDMARAIGAAPFMYLFVSLALDALLRLRKGSYYVGTLQIAALVAVPVVSYANVAGYTEWMAQPRTAQMREPAVEVGDFQIWLESQTAEVRAGRRGMNVSEWQKVRGKVARPLPEPQKSPPARRVEAQPGQKEVPPLSVRLVARLSTDRDDTRLMSPRGVAIGPTGDIFVADTGNRRVQRYNKDGAPVGPLAGEFDEPFDLVVTENGEVYVVDSLRGDIVKIDAQGKLVGRLGAGLGMYRPRGIGIDRAGKLYIADTGHDRVVVMEPDGKVLKLIDGKIGLFQQPTDVAVDRDGHLYVADPTGARLVKLDAQGNYLFEWKFAGGSTFDSPHLAFTPHDTLLVTDPQFRRVMSFAPDGQPLGAIGGPGDGEEKLRLPVGIATDAEGNVYVVDTGASVVKKFSLQ